MKTRKGESKNRFERGLEIFTGDKKTLTSKGAFGMNIIFTALGTTGAFYTASMAHYDKVTLERIIVTGLFAGLAYMQGGEVYRKSGPDYWWVEEKGSKAKPKKKRGKKK